MKLNEIGISIVFRLFKVIKNADTIKVLLTVAFYKTLILLIWILKSLNNTNTFAEQF